MSEDNDTNVFVYSEDLSNAEAPNPLPKGSYPAEVRSASIEDSKSKPGKKNLKLGLYIAPESYPADYLDGNPDGMTLATYQPLDDSTRGRYRMKKFLETFGLKTTRKNVDPNDFMGATCTIENDPRMGNDGMLQENVAKVIARQ